MSKVDGPPLTADEVRRLRSLPLRAICEIELIRCLRTVTAAADFAGVSQPTLTQRIDDLGKTLGVQLFERSDDDHRIYSPTPAAIEVLKAFTAAAPSLLRLLDSLDDVKSRANDPEMRPKEQSLEQLTFAKRIRTLRRRNKVSPEELCARLSVSKTTLYKWENGLGLPRKHRLDALAAALGVTADYLLTGR